MKKIEKVNRYNIYNEENRYEGNVAVQYTALAHSEDRVREMAVEQDIDLTGYTIELEKTDVKNQLGKPYQENFERGGFLPLR